MSSNKNHNSERFGGSKPSNQGGKHLKGGSKQVDLSPDVIELFESIRQNNIDNVKRLIAEGVEINIKDDKERAPIHLAAWHGFRDLLDVLIRHKADVSSKAADGFSAVHFAALSGHADCIRAIADRNKGILNAKTMKGDKTALHIAVSKGKEDVIQALIDSGCDQTAKNSGGQTAFELAGAGLQAFITNANIQRAASKNKELPSSILKEGGGWGMSAAAGNISDQDGESKKRKLDSSNIETGSEELTAESSLESSSGSSKAKQSRTHEDGIGPMLPETGKLDEREE